MPARAKPTAKRSTSTQASSSGSSSTATFAAAPARAQTKNTLLAWKRSAMPSSAKHSVPAMKPSWTALVTMATPPSTAQ